MNEYKHIISLGFFCGTAQEIERRGFRDASYPFDWLRTKSLEHVLQILKNGMCDMLNPSMLFQEVLTSRTYINVDYKIAYVHDFSEWKSFDSQIEEVTKKYQKRVDALKKAINERTLFIRYIFDQDEADYICSNYDYIMSILRASNSNNDCFFIANNDIEVNSKLNSFVFMVNKDKGDSVARRFMLQTPRLVELISKNYSAESVRKNMEFFNQKEKKKKINTYKRKVISAKHRLFDKRYVHTQRYDQGENGI